MKSQILLASALALGWAGSGAAQSVEESYANLCTDEAAAKSETCVALRAALMAKLADQSSTSAAPTPSEQSVSGHNSDVDARWGFYADLPGQSFSSSGALFSYSWKEKGRVIDVHDKVRGTRSTIALLNDGSIESSSSAGSWKLTPAGDGSFLQSDPNGQWRNRISLDEDGLWAAVELLVDGQWITHSKTLSTRVPADSSAATVPELVGSVDTLPVNNSEDDNGPSPASSIGQPVVDPTWGPLLQLVNTTWGVQRVNGLASVDRFTWAEDGAAIKYTGGIEGFFKEEIVFRPGPKTGTSAAVVTTMFGDKEKVLFRFDETGALLSDWYRYAGSDNRHEIRFSADGQYESRKAHGENGAKPDFPPLHGYFRRYSDDGVEPMASQSRAVMAAVNEKVKREHAAEEARKKASGGSGLLGSLVGAAVGAYAGTAAGLDTEQVVGAMMKGASVTGSGPLASALGSTGDQLLTGGSASSALTGGFGNASTAGASYPTKPNLAASACSGFTEGNYRSRALEGGGDSQLNAMCGQAFEYYTMYKRAIAQGYSEADANRTYAAHEQSAQVASGYLSSHGAN